MKNNWYSSATNINPWQTISCKKKYENPWITVTHRDVIDPSGNPGIYGVVEFKKLTVGVLPMDKEQNIWLVRQFRYSIEQYSWEIPEGGVDFGETPLIAAKRELLEEAGVTAKTWSPFLDIHPSNAITNELAKVFLAENLTNTLQDLDSTEDIIAQKFPITQIIDMIMQGVITDSITIAAVLKAKILLNIE